jgi:hypothetical protein
MPLVGFQPTTPVFERAKTVHALDSRDMQINAVACTFSVLLSSNVGAVYKYIDSRYSILLIACYVSPTATLRLEQAEIKLHLKVREDSD